MWDAIVEYFYEYLWMYYSDDANSGKRVSALENTTSPEQSSAVGLDRKHWRRYMSLAERCHPVIRSCDWHILPTTRPIALSAVKAASVTGMCCRSQTITN